MAHHKRRKRKRFGVKGHCTMCAMATRHGGLRNKRVMSMQELRAIPPPEDGERRQELRSHSPIWH